MKSSFVFATFSTTSTFFSSTGAEVSSPNIAAAPTPS
jgi:hypothetical protein